MISGLLCALAFLLSYFGVKRSTPAGLAAVMATGYLYGILRANFLDSFAHFIFDAALIGFYFGYRWKQQPHERARLSAVKNWLTVLIGWPLLIFLLPLQHPLVSLVGLRGNVFFLPMLYVSARLTAPELIAFSVSLAGLNLFSTGFGIAEYVLGVPRFYPYNAVTQIIYNSNDVAGYQFLRIPATFANAHSYAGAMVTGLPFLFAAWISPRSVGWRKAVLLAGMAAAMLGVLMASTRVHFAVAGLLILAAALGGGIGTKSRAMLVALISVTLIVALSNERFQRFKSLNDTDVVSDRIGGSVNRSFWEIAAEYPMGNGLGGGGTSIPFFLEHLVHKPVAMESEYARIMLEQGIPGLMLWLAFAGWFLTCSKAFLKTEFHSGRRLAWLCGLAYLGTAMLGTGLLTAIPQSILLLMAIGWAATIPPEWRHAPRGPQRPLATMDPMDTTQRALISQ